MVVAGVVLLVGIASGTAVYRSRADHPTADLTVGWGGSEGHPACVYAPADQAVDCEIKFAGTAPRRDVATVTVTAYADENTSKPVGSSVRSVPVDGTMNLVLHLTIPVDSPPHVDEDGVAACSLAVSFRETRPS